MTTDELALRRTVCAHPEDDAPRLVLADWYDEHGQEARAEFIRVQIELEPLRGIVSFGNQSSLQCPMNSWEVGDYARGCKLIGREDELLAGHWQHWRPPGIVWGSIQGTRIHAAPFPIDTFYADYRRGFVDQITLPTQSFLDHATAIFSREPITQVTLSDREPLRWTPDSGSASFDWPDRFSWSGRDPIGQRHDIPMVIWQLLVPEQSRQNYARYDSRDLAIADLFAACVRLGRERAGLPDGTTIPPAKERVTT